MSNPTTKITATLSISSDEPYADNDITITVELSEDGSVVVVDEAGCEFSNEAELRDRSVVYLPIAGDASQLAAYDNVRTELIETGWEVL